MPRKLLYKPAILEITGFSIPTLYRRMHRGEFPRCVVVGKGRLAKVAWFEDEVEAWQASLPRSRFPTEQPTRRRLPKAT
jgi:predicted DNA-binding transcriptional regulator AlpA